MDEFTGYKNPREEVYEFNTDWIYTTKTAVVQWLPKKESGIKWPLEKEEIENRIVIPLENDKIAYLTMKFDVLNQIEENTNHCRVKEMLQLAVQYAFDITKADAVQLNVYPINTGAKRCYEKVGFVENMTRKNAFQYKDESWDSCNMVMKKTGV